MSSLLDEVTGDSPPLPRPIQESLHYAAASALALLRKIERMELPGSGRQTEASFDSLIEPVEAMCTTVAEVVSMLNTVAGELAPKAPEDSSEEGADPFDFDALGEEMGGGLPSREEIEDLLENIFDQDAVDAGRELIEMADTCGMCAHELQARLKRLWDQWRNRSASGMMAEAESVQRRSSMGLRRVLACATRLLGEGSLDRLLEERDQDLLARSLRVRRFLLTTRQRIAEILTPLGASPGASGGTGNSAVSQDLVRAADGLLASASTSPGFEELRWGDRRLLMAFRDRFTAILAEWEAEPAFDILSDLRAFSELFLDINRREELVVHDRVLQERCLGELQDLASIASVTSVGVWDRFEEILHEAEALAGRDAGLDAHVSSALEQGPMENPALEQSLERTTKLLLELRC